MPYEAQDDGFHEIQLSGKQLVFLFMATTVVSVVIFLCGVLVGRGVPGQMGADGVAAVETQSAETEPAASASTGDAAVPSPAETQPTSEPGLSYPERLGETKPSNEQLGSASKPTAASGSAAPPAQGSTPGPPPAPAAAGTPPVAKAVPPSNAAVVPPAAKPEPGPTDAQPSGSDKWTVQVAALNQRAEAEAIARRLQSRGYLAYVVSPGAGGGAQMFRVRVGSYADRAEAERVKRRLAQEEQFKPWITR